MMAEELFEHLASRRVQLEKEAYAVNIGCGDGLEFEDPVYPLYAKGFKGVAIDAWPHELLARNLGEFDVILRPATHLTTSNVVSVLREAACPLTPSFLKIDIDGVDAPILESILEGGIRPHVIQAEVNTEIPPPYAFAVGASDRYQAGSEYGFFGFSLTYGDDLLARYGYRFYALDFETPWTHDALWVHSSVMERAGLTPQDPNKAFFDRGPHLYHLYMNTSASRELLISWRTRTDHDVVSAEISKIMLEAAVAKMGHADVPFDLYVSAGGGRAGGR